MSIRGVRGATVVTEDQPEYVLSATRDLLTCILEANPAMRAEDIASVFFTVTDDIQSVHPARAARQLGWDHVPMLCSQEIPVPGSLPLCIRVLLHWNTDLPQSDICHIYLGAASNLRPDLTLSPKEK